MRLHVAQKYEKQVKNDYETASKKWTDKKEDLFFVFRKCINVFKFQESNFKIVQKNF